MASSGIASGACSDTSDCISVYEVTGTGESQLQQLTLYPNPVPDFLQIRSEVPVTTVRIFDALGILVITQITQTSSTPTARLATGTYIVEIATAPEIVRKVIVKN